VCCQNPEFFHEKKQRRIAILSYHKFPAEDWPVEEFRTCRVRLAGGEVTALQLAERGSRLSNLRCFRELTHPCFPKMAQAIRS